MTKFCPHCQEEIEDRKCEFEKTDRIGLYIIVVIILILSLFMDERLENMEKVLTDVQSRVEINEPLHRETLD